MKRIIVSGNHEEMGKQQGNSLSKDLGNLYKSFILTGLLKAKKPWYIPLRVFEKKVLKSCVEKFVPVLEIVEGASERFGGIAAGAKLHLGALSLLHSLEIGLLNFGFSIFSEIAVLITSGKSKSGFSMLLYNLYAPIIFEDHTVLRISHPTSKISSIELTFDYMTGSFAGMNEEGLAVAFTHVYSLERDIKGPMLSTMLQRVLETCQDAECAISLISENDYSFSATLMVSKGEDVYVLEISPTRKKMREIAGGYVIASNHFVTEEMLPLNLSEDTNFPKCFIKGISKNKVMKASRERYQRAQELIMRKEKITVEDAITILKDHGRDFIPSLNTICMHGDDYGTVASVIFIPLERRVLYVSGKPCSTKYKEFRFQL